MYYYSFTNLSCKVTDKNLFENRRYKHIKLNISIRKITGINGRAVTDKNKLNGINKKKYKKPHYADLVNKNTYCKNI